MRDPDWLLDCKPRDVQIEALRRSYQGLALYDGVDDLPFEERLPHFGSPANGWGHFMEMRLGKTATVLNEFMLFKRDHGVRRALIVSPNSLKFGWADEAIRFGLDVPVFVFDSSPAGRKHATAFMRDHAEALVVVNYEAFVAPSNVELFASWLSKPCFMVADESVKIKNPNSVVFKRLFALSKDAAVTRALTGLPAPQAVTDLWSQFRFIRQLDGVNFYQFRATYAKTGGFQGKQIVGLRNEDKLAKLMKSHTFVASRRNWGGYLPPDFDIAEAPLLPAQLEAYKTMERDFIVWLNEEGANVSADQVLAKHIKLQQISSGFIIDEEKRIHALVPFNSTPKFLDLQSRLRDFINGKALVIARYSHTVAELVEHLAEFNPAVIRGAAQMAIAGVSVEDEKSRFNNDPACRVMVAQIDAVKYGHTLVGTLDDPCSTVVFYENSYSLDDRAQAEQRPQGFGQGRCTYILDYASTPIEKAVIRTLQAKRRVSDTILGHYRP